MREKPPPLPGAVVRESEDVFLRRWGFAIHARPREGPVRWKRGRLTYTHAEALVIARRERDDLQKRMEQIHG